MPIYEYECLECGLHFDKLQRFGDPQLRTCPNGHDRVHRLLSEPTIIFKGSGFYVTDHGRNGAGRSARKRERTEASPPAPDRKTDQITDKESSS
jgi:putative FmdB family regulatory protein